MHRCGRLPHPFALHFSQGVGGDQAVLGGVRGHGGAVGGEQEAAARLGDLDGERLDRPAAFGVVADIADVDGRDPAGVLAHDAGVDLRIVLAAVADQDEGQVVVQRQHVADQVELVVLGALGQRVLQGQAPLAQEQKGPDRDAVQVEEGVQHLVDAPGPARDVEHRVALAARDAVMQRAQEGAHARKGHPAFGRLHEQAPEHDGRVGDARDHHGVVDVADHDEAAVVRWDEDVAGRADRARAGQLQVDVVPEPLRVDRPMRAHVDAEIAVAIGARRRLRPLEARDETGVMDAATQEAAQKIEKRAAPSAVRHARAEGRLAEHAPDQEQLGARAVAAIGLDHDRSDRARRAGDDVERATQAAALHVQDIRAHGDLTRARRARVRANHACGSGIGRCIASADRRDAKRCSAGPR
jgi:hypothetical protein